MLRKLFRHVKPIQSQIREKEVVGEMLFRTGKPGKRLMLELMARGVMRVGEVLKLTPQDLEDRKVIAGGPKSGRELEVVSPTQRYLGKVSGLEAMRWIENLHG